MPEPRPVLYPLVPGCRGASREQPREHWGFRSRPVADAFGVRSSATRDRSAGRARQGRCSPCRSCMRLDGASLTAPLPWVNLSRINRAIGQGGRDLTDEDRYISLAGKLLVDKIDAQLLEVQKQG